MRSTRKKQIARMVIAILMGGISKLPVLSQDIELSSSEGFGRMIVSNCTGYSGDFVDVDLHIENPNTPVTAVAMNMIYEPQALQYIEMFPGPGIREWLVLDAIESDPGTLAIAGLAKSDQGFTAGSDGLLLTCRFRVVCAGCSPGCVYPLRVANFQADVSGFTGVHGEFAFDCSNPPVPNVSSQVSGKRSGIPHGAVSVLDPGGLELVMVYLKGGRCSIGSPPNETGRYENEGPVHSVTLDGFWVSCFEVTQAQYEVIMGENPSTFRDPSRPVEMVSWEDAELFCRRASSRIGRTFTLPTEAQWEYACRSGTSASRFWGDDPDAACRYANVSDMTAREKYPEWAVHNCSDGFLGTAPVGSYEPNAFGIYDMIGNVWEWCSDWYDESYYISSPQLNPEGPEAGLYRVFRGGSWSLDADYCRSSYRGRESPSKAFSNLGFRVVQIETGTSMGAGAPARMSPESNQSLVDP